MKLLEGDCHCAPMPFTDIFMDGASLAKQLTAWYHGPDCGVGGTVENVVP